MSILPISRSAHNSIAIDRPADPFTIEFPADWMDHAAETHAAWTSRRCGYLPQDEDDYRAGALVSREEMLARQWAEEAEAMFGQCEGEDFDGEGRPHV